MFKFRSLSDASYANTKQILDDCKIYFSKYEELNDPFEYAYIWTTTETISNKIHFWNKLDDHYKNSLLGQDIKKQTRDITEWETSMAAPRGHRMIGADKVGIFCTSSVLENQVLWSLYADSHRGVCFEFDTDKDAILNHKHLVKYSQIPGEYNLYQGAQYKQILTTKYEDWQYEKEIRVFNEPGLYQFDRKALVSITFGVNAWIDSQNEVKVNELIGICKKKFPDAKLRRALKKDSEYKFILQDI